MVWKMSKRRLTKDRYVKGFGHRYKKEGDMPWSSKYRYRSSVKPHSPYHYAYIILFLLFLWIWHYLVSAWSMVIIIRSV